MVSNVHWGSWGRSTAVGTGTGWYVAPNQGTSQGSYEQATVVAYGLGNCGTTYAYQKVVWYFPQHGDTFDPNGGHYNTCTGADVQP